MSVELKKSFIPNERVKRIIEHGYETVKGMNGGRNPSQEQKDRIKNVVINHAKRIEKDRGAK